MTQGKIAGAERVLLELLAETPRGSVLVFVPQGSPLAERVATMGHHVQNFSLPKLEESGSGLAFARSYINSLRTLTRALVDEDISVVHAFVAVAIKVVAPAAWLTGTPALVSVHEITTSEAIGYARSRLQRILASLSFTRITAVSQFVADTLVTQGYPLHRVKVIHNGIAPPTRHWDSQEQRVVLGLPADALIFIMVGRLTRWKGQQVALSAFLQFRRSNADTDTHLMIVGGPFEANDVAFARELKNASEADLFEGRVHFYGHQDDVEPFYAASDVVLVPSLDPDPFPTVVLEAGLASRPVIATDLGGAREAIVPGQTGLLTAPTANALAQAMGTATDPIWRGAAGEAARRHIASEFSREKFAAHIFAQWEALRS